MEKLYYKEVNNDYLISCDDTFIDIIERVQKSIVNLYYDSDIKEYIKDNISNYDFELIKIDYWWNWYFNW